MTYNFDKVVNRRGTNSLKYDFSIERGKPANALPLWVADMDFQVCNGITKALSDYVEHSIYGYSELKEDYFIILKEWFSFQFNYKIEPNWLVKTPGIVYAISMAIQAFTKVNESVIIQPPVYYPFSESVTNNNRKLITNPLVLKNGHYHIDFTDFEQKIIDNNVKLFIFCSPHNPVGRVWTKDELLQLGNICLKHNVIILSDEIHCDFTYEHIKHNVFSTVAPEFEDISIICTSPSKTFNIAGLQVSNIFISNTKLRNEFQQAVNASGYSQLNTLGLVAAKAAYSTGATWLNQLKSYLTDNLNFARTFLAENLPNIKLIEPEGTYLLWLDCSLLNLSNDVLYDLILNKAGLWIDEGIMFGIEGSGFIRINMACPRSTLSEAFNKLASAFNS